MYAQSSVASYFKPASKEGIPLQAQVDKMKKLSLLTIDLVRLLQNDTLAKMRIEIKTSYLTSNY
jgi:hypothetical protein